jgi:hypothetical protein
MLAACSALDCSSILRPGPFTRGNKIEISDLLPPSPPAEKTTERQDQAGKACTSNGTGDGRGSSTTVGCNRCRPKRGVGATFASLAALRGKIAPDLASPEERGFLLAIRNSNPAQRVPEER